MQYQVSVFENIESVQGSLQGFVTCRQLYMSFWDDAVHLWGTRGCHCRIS